MVDGFWGADTELMAEHSRRMQARGAELLALRAALDVVVRQEQMWQGSDAEAFRAQWTGGAGSELQRLGERLGALGQEVRAHGLEQDGASAAEGAGSVFAGAEAEGVGTVNALPVAWKDLRHDGTVDPSDVSGDYDYDKHYDFDLGEDGPRYSGEEL